MILLEFKNVSLCYDEIMVLESIDLSISSGQILTIMGPNGSGKTSLLRAMGGIIKDYTGQIIRSKKLTVSYMPQKIALNSFIPICVKDLLLLTYHKDDDFFYKIMDHMEIMSIMDYQIHDISIGQLQRVFFARCVLSGANLIILDEPVSSMDIKSRDCFYGLIHFVRDEFNCSIVIASHDLHCVMQNTDEVVCIDKKIQCCGKPDEVESFMMGYFGKSVVPYRHRHK